MPVAAIVLVLLAGAYDTGTIHLWIITVVNHDYSSSRMKQPGLLGYGARQNGQGTKSCAQLARTLAVLGPQHVPFPSRVETSIAPFAVPFIFFRALNMGVPKGIRRRFRAVIHVHGLAQQLGRKRWTVSPINTWSLPLPPHVFLSTRRFPHDRYLGRNANALGGRRLTTYIKKMV